MELVRIPVKELDKVWAIVEKDIKNALAYSSQLTSSDFVLNKTKEGKFQIWVLWDKTKPTSVEKYFGVVVTEIIKRQLGKVCHIYIMTGKQRHKWQHLVKDIEQFAKVECLKKEIGNPRYAPEVKRLREVKEEMISGLANMVPDQDDAIEKDDSLYKDLS